MRQHNGYVLLIVLVYLQLLVLLNITNIKQLTMLKKQIKMQSQQYFLKHEVSNILKVISKNKGDICIRENYPVHYLQIQPLSWWQSHGCSGDSESGKYYYFITDMGKDECAGVVNQSNQLNMVHYYRVTLMLNARSMLLAQKTLVMSEQVPPVCGQQVRVVRADEGVLRWL